MKLYIKGQQFGLDGIGDIVGYLVAVDPTSGNYITTICSDYYSFQGVNAGGIYTEEDIEAIIGFSSLDLYQTLEPQNPKSGKLLASEVNGGTLFENIQAVYSTGEASGTVYVEHYIDVEAYSDCTIDPENYKMLAHSTFTFTVKSDENWTITTQDCTVDTDAGSSGETQIQVTEVSNPTGQITITGESTELTINYI